MNAIEHAHCMKQAERAGFCEGLLDYLSGHITRDATDTHIAFCARIAIERYRHRMMDEAMEGIEPEIPTPAEIDELARVDQLTRRRNHGAPHEL